MSAARRESPVRPERRQGASLPERLLDAKEAAAMLGLKPTTLYQWAYERRISVVKLSGPRGALRFRLSVLMKLIEEWERPALRSPTEKKLDGHGPADGGDQS